VAESAASSKAIPFASALYVLCALVTVLAGGMMLPAFTAIGRHETEIAVAFASAALGGAFFGGGLMLALQSAQRPALMRENIALLVAAWIVLSLFAAIPLVLAGATRSVTDAIFEAASALTTTGASVLGPPERQSPAILLWLAELQWFGGYASILMAATVLSALGTAGLDIQRTLLPLGQSGAVFERFFHIAGSLGWIYATATLTGFFVIWAGGVPRFDAFCLALSGIATGGLKLKTAGFGAYHAPISEIGLVLLMLFGASNFLGHWVAWRAGSWRLRLRAYAEEPELWLLLMACFLAVLLLMSAGAVPHMATSSFVIFNAVSLVTTSGFWAGPPPPPSSAFVLGAIGLVFVGGASVSTVGGLKLMRLWLIFTHARLEIRRLIHPRSPMTVRLRGRVLDEEVLRGIWAFFMGYVLILLFASIVLGGFGLDPVHAMAASVSALANTGPLLDLVSGGPGTYAGLPSPAKWLLCLVMIAGRLEVLAFLSMFHPAFWRK
jgi:trk system potassium uptake protein TrkH